MDALAADGRARWGVEWGRASAPWRPVRACPAPTIDVGSSDKQLHYCTTYLITGKLRRVLQLTFHIVPKVFLIIEL